MNTKDAPVDVAAELRRRAEEIAAKTTTQSKKYIESLSPGEPWRLIHELQVHQIELDMQHEELRRTQAELDASRARFFDLYDLAPAGYVTLNDKGIIIEANLTACAMLAVARGALLMQPLSKFILKEDQDIYYLHRKQLFETEKSQSCDLRMIRKGDGMTFWAHLEGTAAKEDKDEPSCRIVIVDITERKQAEMKIRVSEEHYRSLFGNMLNGFAYCRMIYQNGRPYDFTYLDVNHAFETQTGLTNVIGRNVSEVIPGIRESDQEIIEIYGGVAMTGVPARFERYVKALSMWFSLSVYSPIKDHFVVVFDVITERKKAESTMAEQLDELRRWHDVTIGRENRVAEIKREVNEVLVKYGEPPRYGSVIDGGGVPPAKA